MPSMASSAKILGLAFLHLQNLGWMREVSSTLFACLIESSSTTSSFIRNKLILQLLLLHTIFPNTSGRHNSRDTECAVPQAQQ
jgi:hypothetical protein